MKTSLSAFALLILLLSVSTIEAVQNRIPRQGPPDPQRQQPLRSDSSMASDDLSASDSSLSDRSLANKNTMYELGKSRNGVDNYQVEGTRKDSPYDHPLGMLGGDTRVTRTVSVSSFSTAIKSVALRFRIYLIGDWKGQPCWVNTNEKTVFQNEFRGSNFFKDVEVQIPMGEDAFNLLFACDTEGIDSLSWSISDIGYHFSNCPVEHIGDPSTGDCKYVGGGIFKQLGSGSGHGDVPVWADGSSNPDHLVVHQNPVTGGGSGQISNQAGVFSLFFVGSNFEYSSFRFESCKAGVTYFNGLQVLGPFSGPAIISRQFTALSNTQSAALRIRLYLLGSWTNVPFAFQSSGITILSTMLTGTNTFRDIEVQFAVTSLQTINLSFGISAGQGSAFLTSGAFSWAVSDFAFALSNAPCGQLYQKSSSSYITISTSFFTTLLNTNFDKQFPDYPTQPAWLSKVVQGVFTQTFDIIAVKGTVISLTSGQQNLIYTNILGGSNAYAQGVTASSIANAISFKLFLIGTQFDYSSFKGIGSAGITYLNSFPVFGLFTSSSVISTTLSSISSTQSCVFRLRLHTSGVWVNVPFGFTVGGTSIFKTMITGTNSYHDIELHFALGSTLQQTMAFGISLGSSSVALQQYSGLKWAISDCAVVYSNGKVGQIYNVASKSFTSVSGSFFTLLLTTIFNQQFPDCAIQPVWLNKVALGLFEADRDIIVVNRAAITISKAATSLSTLTTLMPVRLFLIGSNFDYSSFTCNTKTVGITYFNGYPVYGVFSADSVISTTLNTVASTQSIAFRLRLHIYGVWNNVAFGVNSNDAFLLSTVINGANQYVDLEMQFAAGASQKIVLAFGLQDRTSLLQYAISDVAIVYSNAPVGQIYNVQTGGTSVLLNSYFTQLLNTIYVSGFPGYSQQPIWLQKTQLGIFSSELDIIMVNSNAIQLSTTAMTAQSVSQSLTGLIHTTLLLVGQNFDFSSFSCGCQHGITQFHGRTVLGMYSYDNVLTTTIRPPLSSWLSSQSVAFRFTLLMSGNWVNVPFEITANDINVLTVHLTGSNEFQHIEVQFPIESTQSQILFAFSISQSSLHATQYSSLQWAISEVAYAYSNAPVGHIYNTATGGFSKVTTSFFTVLLNSYYLGSFPGVETQPTWLTYVKNGLFSNLVDIISVNGVTLTFTTSSVIASYGLVPVNQQVLQTSQISQLMTFYSQNLVVLELVGSNYGYQNYKCSDSTLTLFYINNIQVLGGLSHTSTLTTSFMTLKNTQAVAYRFTLHIIGTATNAPFTILANGASVFSTTLSMSNSLYQIECQFAAVQSSQIQLSFSFGSVSTSFQWAISEVGYALSSTPVGTIFSLATGGTETVSTSYFTLLLNSLYLAQFPGYATQPSWLQLVLGGNFASSFNIISINGEIVTAGSNAVVLSTGNQVSTTSFYTVLQLIGSNFNYANYACGTGLSLVYLESIPVIGLFNPGSIVTTSLYPLSTTQAAIYRFSLHLVGQCSSQSFLVTANGVNVFQSSLSGTNQILNIEFQFATNSQQAILLSFNFKTESNTASFQWAMSNVAISYSTTKVGTILLASTGEIVTVTGSYFTMLLNSNLEGRFSGAAQQPMWLFSVVNNLFSRTTDFISINSKLVTLQTAANFQKQITSFTNVNKFSFLLLGEEMDLSTWSLGKAGTVSLYAINGIQFIGPFEATSVLSTSVTTLKSTQAIALRFSLYVSGSAVQAPFYVSCGGKNVMSFELTAMNQFRLIEVQFTAQASKSLSISFGFSSLGASSTSFQWALGEVALVLSSTKCGTILGVYNKAAVTLQNSYFTVLFNSYLASTVSTLTSVPTWLSYVRVGQFSNLVDIIVVNGQRIELGFGNYGASLVGLSGPSIGYTLAYYQGLQALQTATSLTTFYSQTSTSLYLIGNSFSFTNFACKGVKLGIQLLSGTPVLGFMTGSSILTSQYTTLSTTQSVALRFKLFLIGNIQNAPFTITSGGVTVFSSMLTGSNTFYHIEAQFAAQTDQALSLAFSFGSISDKSFKWAINELAISFSNSPVGTIFNSITNSHIDLKGSYFTALLNVYNNRQFVGYIQQPSWLQLVLSGCSSGLNHIISVNNVILNIESLALSSSSFNNFGSSFLQSTETRLLLIGTNMNLQSWSLSTGTLGITYIGGIPALGQLSAPASLSTSITLLSSTQSVAMRFMLYVTGQASKVPFYITANGAQVFSFVLSAKNEFRLIEAQFACQQGSSLSLAFHFDSKVISSSKASFQWAISDLAYSLSNTAVGTIFNSVTGNAITLQTSYFTALLRTYYQGTFSGYSTQPIWLSYVLSGQFNSAIDVISINSQLVDLTQFALSTELISLSKKAGAIIFTGAFDNLQYLQAATLGTQSTYANFYSNSRTYLQLIGSSFDFSSFTSTNCGLQIIPVQGFSALGGLTATGVLKTTISLLKTTQSVATRFTLFLIGQVSNVPFIVTANGVNVLNTVLTGTNTYRYIELQFNAAGGTEIPLVFSFGTSSLDASALGFKWAIGEYAVSLSNTPVGTLYNCVNGGFTTVSSSYFTQLLTTYFQGQFPGAIEQPSWLSYVLNGQFSSLIDIIAVNGALTSFPSTSVGLLSLQASGSLAKFFASTSTFLYLTGSNFDLNLWSASCAKQMSIIKISEISVLGTFGGSDTLFTVLTPLAQTQSVALRFMLFMMGDWQNVNFNVAANNVQVLQVVLSGQDQYRHIELQFPYTYSASSSQVILSFSAVSQQSGASFQWAIGQVAVSHCNSPVGYISNYLTGSTVTLLNSYYTTLLNVFLSGQFTGYTQQPIWLNYVRSGSFTSSIDIIAVKGTLLDLNTVSVSSASALASFIKFAPTAEIKYTNAQSSLTLFQTSISSYLTNFLSSSKTILQLVGSNLDFSLFSCTNEFGLVYPMNSIPAIGYFSPTSVVTQTLIPITGTKTVAMRFSLFTSGQMGTAPLTILANGVSVFSAILSASSSLLNIEVQFPYTVNECQPGIVLSVSFNQVPTVVATKAVSLSSFQWAIGQVAIHYSNTPLGYVFNPVNNGNSAIMNSYFTPLLQNLYAGSFPDYKEQPIWLNQVLFGQYSSETDFIGVGGNLLNLAGTAFSLAKANAFTAHFLTTTETILELVGTNFNLDAFSCTNGQIALTYINEIPVLGKFAANSVLSTSLYPLAATKAVALRFQLFLVGQVTNVPFNILANGANVFTVMLTANNEYRFIEVQFPYKYIQNAASVGLTFSFNTASLQSSATSFQWAVSQMAFSYSNAPVGYIYSSATGGNVQLVNSYFTQLLGTYLQGSFPGYSSQPLWLNYVLNGQFDSKIDIISINSVLVKFPVVANVPASPSMITLTASFESLQLLQSTSLISTFLAQTSTVLYLIGTDFDYTQFSCSTGAKLGLTYVSGLQILGTLSQADILSTTFTALSSTQAVALRFTLFFIGAPAYAPFNIQANGVTVLTTVLTGSSSYQNIEVQFPCAASEKIMLSFNFGTTKATFQWGIGQVAVHYSNAPVGFILNSATGGYTAVSSSYFTQVLGVYYGGSFPGYTIQPTWLAVVKNAQFSSQFDIISINGNLVNFANLGLASPQNSLVQTNFFAKTLSVLELVGSNFAFNNFALTSGSGALTTTKINSIVVLGQFSASNVISYTLSPISSTKAVAVRFMLFVTGTADNAQFLIQSNGRQVFSGYLSGTNFFRNIEIQFPCTYSQSQAQLPLSFSFVGVDQSSTSFQWAVSQLAVAYSNAPVGYIYSSLTGGNVPLVNSYFNQLLSVFYSSSFPGYAAEQQPLWVPYVLAGQFNSAFDMIAINGFNLNLAQIKTPYYLSFPTAFQTSTGVVSLTSEFSTVEIIQANKYLQGFNKQTLTVLELVGSTFSYSNFKSSSTINLVFVNNVASIGYFTPTSTCSYDLVPLTSTQAGIVRFTLYLTGTLTNVPFLVSVGGTNVLTVSLTGTNIYRNIEVQFPLTYSKGSTQGPLVFSFGSEASSLSFTWAISQFAVHYSNAPVGSVFNSITGGYTPVASSYFSNILQLYYSGSFPGYSTQPNWLSSVLSGEFTNEFDIIAVQGTVLNLGSPNIRTTYLSTAMYTAQFLSQTKTVLELVGPKFGYSNFACEGVTLGTTSVGSIITLGSFKSTSVLTYTLVPLTYTQAGVVRFTLFVQGTVSNLPFTVTLGGVNVLNTVLAGTNFFRNIEIQFPLAYSQSQSSFALNFQFQSAEGVTLSSLPFTWSIGQFAVAYSNTPVGFILSRLTGGNIALSNSFFTVALQTYYAGSFPGYTTEQQPLWLSYVLNGQFNNELDIIAVKGVVLNLITEVSIPTRSSALALNTAFTTLSTIQANSFFSTFQSQTAMSVELVGVNFALSGFKSETPFGIVYFNSIPILGYLTSTSTLSYSLAPTELTQTGIIRFQFYGKGTYTNVPFIVSANNVKIFSVLLSGTDFYKNIEIQFPLTYIQGQSQIPLMFSFDTSSLLASDTKFQWGIGQFAVAYSSAPVGFFLNSVSGGYAPIVSSYFTSVLPVFYSSSFPSCGLAQQPIWLDYVLNGQFTNSLDLISVNGAILNFDHSSQGSQIQVLQASNYASVFAAQTRTVLELVGDNFSFSKFSLSIGTLGTTTIGSMLVLGQIPATSVLSYPLSPLSYTKSAALRFMLFVSGSCQNAPFVVSVNGVNVLRVGLSGSNFFHSVEVQFPLSLSYNLGSEIALACSFDTTNMQGSNAPSFQWAISQFALTYSNAPLGFIFNSHNGGYSPISSSFFTPLLGIFYSNAFPGYTTAQQPIWRTYVLNGQFQNGIDIIALNNVVLNFGTASTVLNNDFSGLKIFQANNYAQTFTSQTKTFLLLVGDNFDTSAFTCTTPFQLLHINSVAAIGYFSPSSVLSTKFTALSSTQSVALRFTLFLLGDEVNAPLIITANGVNVFKSVIRTTGYYQNVECAFPYSYSSSQPGIELGITFETQSDSFQWAFSQVAVSLSNAPVGFIFNSATGGHTQVVNSYFTVLLQNHLGGTFPGYTAAQQPIWLTYVLNGQFNNAVDVIVVNNNLLNFASASPYGVRNSLIKASFFTQTVTNLELVGTNFGYSSFKISSGSIGTVNIGGIPCIGQFAPTATLSYTLVPKVSTQSAHLRFILFISGTATNVPFTLTANNVQILSTSFSGTDFYKNIEVQFPCTLNAGQANNILAFSFGNAGSSKSFQWAVSQLAVSYSNAPAGFIFNPLTLGYSPIRHSYFSSALGIFYGSSFPGYETTQQPIWLSYVLNEQFNNEFDIIVSNGNLLNFSPYAVALKSSIATPLTLSFSALKIMQTNSFAASILPQLITVLELVGVNFATNAFTYNTGNFGLEYIDGTPVLGQFLPSTIVNYGLAPLESTKSIVVRFNLHTIGTLNTIPFTLLFNGVNVLQTEITSMDSLHYVEAHFPYTASNANKFNLAFNFAQVSQSITSFKWAISNLAVTYSSAPAGYIYNSVTGENNAITTSFHTVLLRTYYNGAYPGYTAQPTWLSHVLNGQFVNSVDIIAIGGNTFDFGRLTPTSVGLLELHSIPQTSSSLLNFVPFKQNMDNRVQFGGVTQSTAGLFDFGTMSLDLVGSPLSNLNQWTVSSGNINTIFLNGVSALGYFSPGVVLTRQYLNLGSYNSLGTIFQLFVASPTGFNFRVQASGVTILQLNLEAGTYSRLIEAHFEIAKPNVVLTFAATLPSSVALENSGGWAIGSVGFLNNPCSIRHFYNHNVNKCQYAGTSVFRAHSYVNYQQGFSQLTAQPSWVLAFYSNNIGTENQLYFINNAKVSYLIGSETSLVTPQSIHQLQYTLLGGNHLFFDLVGSNFDLSPWSSSAGACTTSTVAGTKVLGVFDVSTVLKRTFATTADHATIVLRFRLHGVGDWKDHGFYVTLNGLQIFTRKLTLTDDFRDIELQFTHTGTSMQLGFGVNTYDSTPAAGVGFAISNLMLHLNPCAIKNTYNVLFNTCMKSGDTAVYSLYTSDYYGQFYKNAGLNLAYLSKFQGLFGLKDDGREVYDSWTGETPALPTPIANTGQVLVELSGSNFAYKDWQVRGTRQRPYTSELYGSTLFGPYESVTVIRRLFTGLTAHTSVTCRLRLYLVGSWIDQNTVFQVGGTTVFQYVLGVSDTYEDIEFTFDHSLDTLDLTILSNPSTSAGARQGIQFGISDFALYANPCAQRNYFDIGLGSCAKTSGYSTFYNIVQSNLKGAFPTVATRPIWTNVLTPSTGISDQAHEVYGFLRGSQLEVIFGTLGKPKFVDLDLITRLKDQISSTNVNNDGSTQALSYLSGRSSTNIIGDYSNGTITSYGTEFDNLFGSSFKQSQVSQFQFAFGILNGWACVGMIETDDIRSLDLNAEIRDNSLVVCSDMLTQANTKFQVNIDTASKTITFQDQFYKDQSKQLKFKNADKLYYTVQFYDKGTIYFGESADAYQRN